MLQIIISFRIIKSILITLRTEYCLVDACVCVCVGGGGGGRGEGGGCAGEKRMQPRKLLHVIYM